MTHQALKPALCVSVIVPVQKIPAHLVHYYTNDQLGTFDITGMLRLARRKGYQKEKEEKEPTVHKNENCIKI